MYSQVYLILDEFILAGELQETSKKVKLLSFMSIISVGFVLDVHILHLISCAVAIEIIWAVVICRQLLNEWVSWRKWND